MLDDGGDRRDEFGKRGADGKDRDGDDPFGDVRRLRDVFGAVHEDVGADPDRRRAEQEQQHVFDPEPTVCRRTRKIRRAFKPVSLRDVGVSGGFPGAHPAHRFKHVFGHGGGEDGEQDQVRDQAEFSRDAEGGDHDGCPDEQAGFQQVFLPLDRARHKDQGDREDQSRVCRHASDGVSDRHIDIGGVAGRPRRDGGECRHQHFGQRGRQADDRRADDQFRDPRHFRHPRGGGHEHVSALDDDRDRHDEADQRDGQVFYRDKRRHFSSSFRFDKLLRLL